MVKRLRGLDDLEQTACLIAERALGVTATPYDVAGRQRAVEAFLDYPDGRRCAFEVTQLRPARGLPRISRTPIRMRCARVARRGAPLLEGRLARHCAWERPSSLGLLISSSLLPPDSP
jgi:hypothetical protein